MNKTKTRKQYPVWRSVLTSGLCAVLTSAVLSMLFAMLIVNSTLPAEWIPYLSCAATAISVFFAALLLCNGMNENKLICAIGSAAIYFTITKAIQLLWLPSKISTITTAAICIAAAFAGALCTAGKGRRRHKT